MVASSGSPYQSGKAGLLDPSPGNRDGLLLPRDFVSKALEELQLLRRREPVGGQPHSRSVGKLQLGRHHSPDKASADALRQRNRPPFVGVRSGHANALPVLGHYVNQAVRREFQPIGKAERR